jgi:hypothetical protein
VSAIFTGPALFVGANFSGPAFFDSASFSGDADFRRLGFSGHADFQGASFSGDASFDRASFSGDAWFDSASFSGDASYRHVKFSAAAGFDKATFSGDISFFDVRFSDDAYFESASFSGDTSFDGSHIGGDALFSRAHFSGSASFDRVSFSGDAWFALAKFDHLVSFDAARFHGPASFYAVRGDRGFTMADASFDVVPDFIQAHFEEAPRLDNVTVVGRMIPTFPDLPARKGEDGKSIEPACGEKAWHALNRAVSYPRRLAVGAYRRTVKADRDNPARWRALQRLAIQAHDEDLEKEFRAREVRAARFAGDWPTPWRGHFRFWFGILYGLFSNYGRSVARPALWWVPGRRRRGRVLSRRAAGHGVAACAGRASRRGLPLCRHDP